MPVACVSSYATAVTHVQADASLTFSTTRELLGWSVLLGGLQFNTSPLGVIVMTQQVMNLTSIREDMGPIPGPAQWVKDLVFP